jgi:membrane-bound ClpP family serine protease
MIGLGVILLILGLLFPHFSILVTIGIVLIVVGVLLNFVPIRGRHYRVW